MATTSGTPGDAPAIEFAGVSCLAQRKDTDRPTLAVADVVLSVAVGEFVALAGPPGAGKTTLLELAAGLALPSTGTIRILGRPLVGLNRRAGYVHQADALLPWRDARDNVAAGMLFAGIGSANARRQADEWLARLDLLPWAGCLPHELSVGLRRRVALAQALAPDPDILLLDEPFAGVDLPSRQRMEAVVLERWSSRRTTVLLTTQSVDEGLLLADRVVALSAGPGSQPIGNFPVPLERPRDSVEMRTDRRFLQLLERIGSVLHDEAMRGDPMKPDSSSGDRHSRDPSAADSLDTGSLARDPRQQDPGRPARRPTRVA